MTEWELMMCLSIVSIEVLMMCAAGAVYRNGRGRYDVVKSEGSKVLDDDKYLNVKKFTVSKASCLYEDEIKSDEHSWS